MLSTEAIVGSKSSQQKPALQYNITDDDSRGSFYSSLVMKAININVVNTRD